MIVTTDDAGNVLSQSYYETYGEHADYGAMPSDKHRANTKVEDADTSLLLEGHRYRLLGAGIFLSPDPLEYVDGLHRYAYCGFNPWGRFDPTGLYEQSLWTRDLDMPGGSIAQHASRHIDNITPDERKAIEPYLSDRQKSRLDKNTKADGSTSIVIGFFGQKNKESGEDYLEVRYDYDVDSKDSDKAKLRKNTKATEIKPKEGFSKEEVLVNTFKATAEYEKNEKGVKYAEWRTGLDQGNCNSSQNTLNFVSGAEYTNEKSIPWNTVNKSALMSPKHFGKTIHDIAKRDSEKRKEVRKENKD